MIEHKFSEEKRYCSYSVPTNEKAYSAAKPYAVAFSTVATTPLSYTAALNGAISANLKPAEDVFYYSLIDATGLDFPKPTDKEKEYTPTTLTITTGAKAQNWKLNLTLNNQSVNPAADEEEVTNGDEEEEDGDEVTDDYIGIDAGLNKLNLGRAFGNDQTKTTANRGVAFTANLTVSVSGKGGDEYYGYTNAIGIYSGSGISVNGTMKGSVNVKNTQTMGGISTSYGFRTAGELVFAKDITGKITVNSDSKWMMASTIAMEAGSIDIAGDIKNAISVVANCPMGEISMAQMFTTDVMSESSKSSSYDGHIHIGGINAKLTATAKSANPKAGEESGGMGGAMVALMYSIGDIVISGSVTKDVTATATSKTMSSAQAFYADSGLIFNGEIAGKITASATGGFMIIPEDTEPSDLESASVTAQTIYSSDKVLFRSNVTKDITATAKGEFFAVATAIGMEAGENSENANVEFLGVVKGKISANASVKKGFVSATAIDAHVGGTPDITFDNVRSQSGMIVFEKGIDNAVSAKASGSQEDLAKMASDETLKQFGIYNSKQSTAEEKEAAKKYLLAHADEWAYLQLSPTEPVEATAFIAANDITVHDINGAITASATTKGGAAKAFAFEMNEVNYEIRTSESGMTEHGIRSAVLNVDNVNKNITVTAKSSGIAGKAFAAAVGKTINPASTEFDLTNSPDLVLNGSIKGKITVTATAKDMAYASGIYANKGIFGSASFSFGTINVTANGDETSYAIGAHFTSLEMDKYAAGVGTISGNLSVTCKNGGAAGVIIESVKKSFANEVIGMNIKVTGKEACAIQLGSEDKEFVLDEEKFVSAVTLSGTVSATTTDKLEGKAYAIKGGNETADIVNILSGAKITGAIDLGNTQKTGTTELDDKLYIHAGANVKGDISNVEKVWFVLDDASTAKKAMWQGDFVDGFADTELGISAYYGEEGTFTLFQTTTMSADDFNGRQIELRIDDSTDSTINLTDGTKSPFGDYDYTLNFTDGKKGGMTATLTIVKTI